MRTANLLVTVAGFLVSATPTWAIFLQVDPAREYHNPYSYGGRNPMNGYDPNGENWFQNPETQDWFWAEGDTHEFKGSDGSTQTLTSEHVYMVQYEVTRVTETTTEGELRLYKQNQVWYKTKAFSIDPRHAEEGYLDIQPGTYTMYTWLGISTPEIITESNGDQRLAPGYGFQDIPNDPEFEDFRDIWGTMRIAVHPSDALLKQHGHRANGNYIHGRLDTNTSGTHGCVCDRNQVVLKPIRAIVKANKTRTMILWVRDRRGGQQ